jgi:hypothetical protein
LAAQFVKHRAPGAIACTDGRRRAVRRLQLVAISPHRSSFERMEKAQGAG